MDDNANVVEQADTADSKPAAERREGSTPSVGTVKTPATIIAILHSIKDVCLRDGEVWVKFDPESTTFPDGWEPNAGFVYNSFTRELLELIEAELKGELAQ